jgi:hypothetical protein
MKAASLLAGLEVLPGADNVWCVRIGENYDRFLDLYKQVGYAPVDPLALRQWQQRSLETWSKLDQGILEGSYAGGTDADGRVVSGWGTLPISPTVAYGHSVCMERTLSGVASLYLPALHSLAGVDRIAGISYWAGSYARRSGFTSRFQKSDVDIPNQIAANVIRYMPKLNDDAARRRIVISDSTEGDLNILSEEDALVFYLLSRSHPSLRDIHSVRAVAVRDERDQPLGLLLIPQAVAELTASNVFSWVWAFPAIGTDPRKLASILRQSDVVRDRTIQVVMPEPITSEFAHTFDEVPSFWVFTPRASMAALRLSIRGVFEHVIDKYAEAEIDAFARRIGLK